MKINFKSKKLKKKFETRKELEKAYGTRQAKKITQRMNELYAAESLQDIKHIPSSRLHQLSGNYKTCFAIDLVPPYRLIIKPEDGDIEDLRTMTLVEVVNVEDYH
jgi:plasmid maintenance system killer protein